MCSCWEAHLKCDCTPTVLKHGLHPVCVCLEICVRSSLLGRHSESKTWRWTSGILQCYLKSCDMGDWDWHIFTIFPGGSDGKESAFRRPGFDPCVRKIPWKKESAAHSSILIWRIPWTEEPGGLPCTGSQSQTRLSDWAHILRIK